MCERHVSATELVDLSERGEAGVDGMASLHTDKRSYLTTCIRSFDVRHAGGECEGGRVLPHHQLDDVHLVNEASCGVFIL